MKKILIFIIFILFTPNYFLATDYKEINEIIKLNKDLSLDTNSTLFIFRLDNTLIRLEQMLGSIEWFENRKNQLQSLSNDKAIKQTLLEWLTIQNLTKCKLVDENTSFFLKNLQEIGFPILIITERPFYLIRATQSQLKNLNINLSLSYYGKQVRIIENSNDYEGYNTNEFLPIILQNGVLFTSGIINNINFSTALNLFFQQSKSPKHIVYIDQNKNHIKDIKEFCQKKSINFTGIRFSAADQEINNFNEKIANIQLSYLQSFFSPETLKLLVNVS